MSTATLAAARPTAFARGRPASSLAAEQPLTAHTFPAWKGPATDLSKATLAALVALLAVLVALVTPGLASGLTGGHADHVSGVAAASAEAHPALQSPDVETRVRASAAAGSTRVGPETAGSAGLHPDPTVSYDQPVSGWLVAPEAVGGGGRLLWGSWNDYPKVTVGGREYAQIGDRLYSHHAVDRLQPSGLGAPAGATGAGRSISPTYVEDVISGSRGAPVKGPNGEPRLSFTSGSVQVITENGIVVTVITR